MSDPRIDALAEAARNRGLKLVRSRVRKEIRRRFGKVGLTDKAGKPVFGMDEKGPMAKPEEAEEYLRKLNMKDWGASLDVAAPQRKRTGRKTARKQPANDAPPPKPKPKPKPPPKPQIREAKPTDALRLVDLMKLLGHEATAPGVRKRVTALAKSGTPQLVATLGKDVVGLVGIDAMIAVHREQPVGRITILVVAEEARERGLGRMLVKAAEEQLRKRGCRMVEITSNDRLTAAHAFYRHLGYERTSIRFKKSL